MGYNLTNCININIESLNLNNDSSSNNSFSKIEMDNMEEVDTNKIEKFCSGLDLLNGEEYYFIKYKFDGDNSDAIYNLTLNLSDDLCKETIENILFDKNEKKEERDECLNTKLEDIFENTNNNDIDFSDLDN